MRTRASVLIGRDAEILSIEQMLRDARSGRGGAVFIVGEGGIGKSRLAAGGADRAYAMGMQLLRGRGSSIGPMAPFHALTEALMSLLRHSNPVDVEGLGPYRAVLARLVPDLGPASAGEEGQSLAVLAEAVLRLLAAAGRAEGCLLVLEDLHDTDAETLAVVDYLASNLDREPALLIGTSRPGRGSASVLVEAAVQRGAGTLIELGRLDAGGVGALAASCLGGDVPADVANYLWNASGGVPLLVEELIGELVSGGALVRTGQGWRTAGGQLRTRLPASLTRTTAEQLGRVSDQTRRLLSVAAALGRRFPLAVLQTATGLPHPELLGLLHVPATAQLVAPDDETPDWYAFQHPLIADAVLALESPEARREIAATAAAAVSAAYPGLPGEWCQAAADLYLQAGDRGRAGRLFVQAGQWALAQGAAQSAIVLLDKALESLDRKDNASSRAEALAALLYALAEAGRVERAMQTAAEVDRLAGLLGAAQRAAVHTRLAWAAAVAGRYAEGAAQVETARRLLGPDASGRDIAPVDVVAAHLALDIPGPGQVQEAERLARRAAREAETAGLPHVACQAWQLLGALRRTEDPAEATGCLERALAIAVEAGLLVEEIHVLVRLGNDDALRDAGTARLEQAQAAAIRAGAVTSQYQAEASLALYAILAGDFAAAEEMTSQVLAATTRLGLLETIRYTLMLRAILGAHRGSRADMAAALAELHQWEGDHSQHAPRVHGLARAWCALLEENRPLAREELDLAVVAAESSPTVFQLTGRQGLRILLRALDGDDGGTPDGAGRLRWDRQFSLLAEAVLAGRAGNGREAAAAVEAALRAAAPYPVARNLGLRLVSEAAVADGWGSPEPWLREAESFFHERGLAEVASACRGLLRRAGATVTQRRRGAAEIPPGLRATGVTVREFEILRLLAGRLTNREIGERLFLSPRTVEKHVASLALKTGQPDRTALGRLGRDL